MSYLNTFLHIYFHVNFDFIIPKSQSILTHGLIFNNFGRGPPDSVIHCTFETFFSERKTTYATNKTYLNNSEKGSPKDHFCNVS